MASFHKKKLQSGVQDARRPCMTGVLGRGKNVFDKKGVRNQARASSRATATELVRLGARHAYARRRVMSISRKGQVS